MVIIKCLIHISVIQNYPLFIHIFHGFEDTYKSRVPMKAYIEVVAVNTVTMLCYLCKNRKAHVSTFHEK